MSAMDEKHLLDDEIITHAQRTTSSRMSIRPRAVLVGCLAALSLLTFPRWMPAPTCSHAVQEHIYVGEKISWKPCGDVSGRPVECSNIDVPMDQFNATASGDKTFNISLIRMRGKDATKNLLLNPGGPGGSGVEFLHRRGKQLSDIVGEGYHLLSFDPRGINGSTPVASCYPTEEARKQLSEVPDSELKHDSAIDYAWTQNFVKACADTMGEHGRYINTPQTAADMNSILDAVGQANLTYWGFSYGTILGQTYASLFPSRSERVIIDGVANNFKWFSNDLDAESFTNTEDVLDGFFDECMKAGKNCTLSSLAESKEELEKMVFKFSKKLKKQPISVYVNSTVYGALDYPSLWYNGIFPSLYKPASWYGLADNLAQLLRGNATAAWLAYGQDAGWGIEGEANQFVTFSDALTGPKYWTQDREEFLEQILSISNESIFAATEGKGFYTRQQWAIEKTHNFTQKRGVQTAHPLLILSTTYDPICPLISAESAHEAFEGSQIVEVLGYGHCSVAVASTCLAKNVRNFLYNGTLPAGHTKCEVDGPYFVKPEEDGKVVAQKVFDNTEEEKIHLAQLQLARDWQWRI